MKFVHAHPEQWAAYAVAPGEQLRIRYLAYLSHGIEAGENTRYSLPSLGNDNSCRSRDSNPQPRVTSPTLFPLGYDCPTFNFS